MVRARGVSAWVLVRGWGRESRHWERFPECFAAHLPESRLTMLDLPDLGAPFNTTIWPC